MQVSPCASLQSWFCVHCLCAGRRLLYGLVIQPPIADLLAELKTTINLPGSTRRNTPLEEISAPLPPGAEWKEVRAQWTQRMFARGFHLITFTTVVEVNSLTCRMPISAYCNHKFRVVPCAPCRISPRDVERDQDSWTVAALTPCNCNSESISTFYFPMLVGLGGVAARQYWNKEECHVRLATWDNINVLDFVPP